MLADSDGHNDKKFTTDERKRVGQEYSPDPYFLFRLFRMLGAVTEPLDLNLIPMMFNQLSLSSSPVGSPATIRKMLKFAARHQIAPVTERFPMSQANEAIAHLESGKARYRIVLDCD